MYVYILRSLTKSNERYIGLTNDIKTRLAQHNAGDVFHTRKFMPWKFSAVVWFENHNQAVKFEKYLKTGSGCAFRARHFEG